MCIIAVKPKGVALPSTEILKRMFYKNPDGAGIAYAVDGVITINKGLMKIEDYLKAVQKIPVNATAIIHTRISTSGGINKELTHPYKLSNDFKELRKTSIKTADGYAVAHNGVFSEFGAVANANDTMQFITTYLHPLKELKKQAGGDILDDDIKPLINKLVNGSRLVILDTNGNYKLYGHYWYEDEGIYYSNEGYKQYNHYNNYYGGSYWHDYNDEIDEEYYNWWDKYTRKNKTATQKQPAQQPAPKTPKPKD